MEKEERDYFWKILYEDSWCPLFGKIPDNDYPQSSIVSRCINIIKEARSMWGSYPWWDDDVSSWPEQEEVGQYDYPECALKSARAIWINRCHISQYAPHVYRDPRLDWYKKENGTSELIHTLDTAWENTIYFARNSWPEPDDQVTDDMILAILAIDEAKSVLTDILCHEISEDEPYLLKQVLIASSLLNRAEKIISEEAQIFQDRFNEGRLLSRKDALSEAIENIYLRLTRDSEKITAKDVLNELRHNKRIQEIDEDNIIYWMNYRGVEKKTTFKAFLNRFTSIKRNNPPTHL